MFIVLVLSPKRVQSSSRKYFVQAPQNALSRSRARGRRPKTPRNGPLAPVPQAPHHARAPAKDDPPRSHPSGGAPAPAASSPWARSAGQPIIASHKKACRSSGGYTISGEFRRISARYMPEGRNSDVFFQKVGIQKGVRSREETESW